MHPWLRAASGSVPLQHDLLESGQGDARNLYAGGVAEVYAGDTYPVHHESFVMLCELLPDDRSKIQQAQQLSEATHRRQGRLWVMRD